MKPGPTTLLAAFALLFGACRPPADGPLFERLDSTHTRVGFTNTLGYAYEFNVYRYRNFYNGGGVALGDVNGDGLPDIYLVGNQVPNRLYLNEGNFRFTDVTETAGVAGARAWSTGVTMADVSGDGLLDIYVCNSGIVEGDDRRNELFVNRGDGTFSEEAEAYGLADAGLSVHGSFLDYDGDGDLDLYLVNNSYRNIGSFDLAENTRTVRHAGGGDRLYRNDGGGRFEDASEEAGIYGSEIGFGLGVSTGDINRDGWPDLYVSNDFFERDYLYVNNRDGTFREILEETVRSVSAAAMGADMADLNADGWPDLFVTDMLPKDELRLKTVTSFDSWQRYQSYVRDDYWHQFTRNTLQLNRGPSPLQPVHFSEVGRLSGVEASDWSWGALIADFDLDGVRDLFVANGIYRDLTNADYLVDVRSEETKSRLIGEDYVDWETLIDMIPSNPVPNHMFAGRRDLRFRDVTAEWGLGDPGFSNGSAYGDLDNDGDQDLVVNNLNMEAFVYRNRAGELHPKRAWLQLELVGTPPNTHAVGAQVTAWANGRAWFAEQQPARGFQSSVDPVLHLGLGGVESLDSLLVRWPDGTRTPLRDVEVGQRLRIGQMDGARDAGPGALKRGGTHLVRLDPAALGLSWRHRENPYNDFTRQPLLFHMRSTEGPPLCVADVSGDGLDDLFVGGAKDQPGAVFVQRAGGGFARTAQPALDADGPSEDTECALFDADADGDRDLFVASGSSELPRSSSLLLDRLYRNGGGGAFVRDESFAIHTPRGFEPTGAVAVADVDLDGDTDLFVGARLEPFAFGRAADGHLLLNDGSGAFREVTDRSAPELRGAGLFTDARWADVDLDGDPDLVVAGEWMPLTVFDNDDGRLVRRPLPSGSGWWQALEVADLDGDGDPDIVAGNHGLNSRFRASEAKPVEMWTDDFDRNGSVEQIVGVHRGGGLYPLALRHDLVEQLPYLVRLYPTYASFAGRTVQEVFTAEELGRAVHLLVTELASVVGWNDGTGRFTFEPLPMEVQLAPMYGIEVADIAGDGRPEILLGGNLYEAKPEVGRYDASWGAALQVTSDGLRELSFDESGFWLDGQVRRLHSLEAASGRLLIAARNGDSLAVFAYDN